MTVSVIVPNYNHARYLPQRIDSILAQSYQDFELIILDDCSTDDSRAVIETYRDHPNVSRIEYNSENTGSLFRQWKKGVELAGGQYVWIAESDDFAEPELLQELVAQLDANAALGLAYCDSRIVFDNGAADPLSFGQHRNEWLNTTKWNSSYTNNGRQEISDNLLEMCTINNASAVLFRKSALLGADPFDIALRYTGDWYSYLKVCLNNDLAYVNLPLNNYREHSENTFKKSRTGNSFVREYFQVYNWIVRNIDFIPREKILEKFYVHTRHTLARNWSADRLRLYSKLFKLNQRLFLGMIGHNLSAGFKKR